METTFPKVQNLKGYRHEVTSYTLLSRFIDAKQQYLHAKRRLNRFCVTERITYNEIRDKSRKPGLWLSMRAKSKHFENVKASLLAYISDICKRGKGQKNSDQKEEKNFPLSFPSASGPPVVEPQEKAHAPTILVLSLQDKVAQLDNQVGALTSQLLDVTRQLTLSLSENAILKEEAEASKRDSLFRREAYLSLMDTFEKFKAAGAPSIIKLPSNEYKLLKAEYARQVKVAELVKHAHTKPSGSHLKGAISEEKQRSIAKPSEKDGSSTTTPAASSANDGDKRMIRIKPKPLGQPDLDYQGQLESFEERVRQGMSPKMFYEIGTLFRHFVEQVKGQRPKSLLDPRLVKLAEVFHVALRA